MVTVEIVPGVSETVDGSAILQSVAVRFAQIPGREIRFSQHLTRVTVGPDVFLRKVPPTAPKVTGAVVETRVVLVGLLDHLILGLGALNDRSDAFHLVVKI